VVLQPQPRSPSATGDVQMTSARCVPRAAVTFVRFTESRDRFALLSGGLWQIGRSDRPCDILGQQMSAISRSVEDNAIKKEAANACGVRLGDGGRERSRTSDPYSIKERISQVLELYCCRSVCSGIVRSAHETVELQFSVVGQQFETMFRVSGGPSPRARLARVTISLSLSSRRRRMLDAYRYPPYRQDNWANLCFRPLIVLLSGANA